VDALMKQLPPIDILVNNVGIFEPKPFAEIPDEDWYHLFEVNVMSGGRMLRILAYRKECHPICQFYFPHVIDKIFPVTYRGARFQPNLGMVG
jgi:NAD(P)-dependent dehydrogenase (short-subunit alcohol dehydrogenase family)